MRAIRISDGDILIFVRAGEKILAPPGPGVDDVHRRRTRLLTRRSDRLVATNWDRLVTGRCRPPGRTRSRRPARRGARRRLALGRVLLLKQAVVLGLELGAEQGVAGGRQVLDDPSGRVPMRAVIAGADVRDPRLRGPGDGPAVALQGSEAQDPIVVGRLLGRRDRQVLPVGVKRVVHHRLLGPPR